MTGVDVVVLIPAVCVGSYAPALSSFISEGPASRRRAVGAAHTRGVIDSINVIDAHILSFA